MLGTAFSYFIVFRLEDTYTFPSPDVFSINLIAVNFAKVSATLNLCVLPAILFSHAFVEINLLAHLQSYSCVYFFTILKYFPVIE